MKEQILKRKYSILLAFLITYFFAINALVTDYILPRYNIDFSISKREIISPLSKALPIAHAEAPAQKQSGRAFPRQEPNDIEIAGMIRSKAWNYSIAVRVAKSENFWNKTQSFDCSRNNAGTNMNGSTDYGIFAINTIHRAEVEQMYGMPFEQAMIDCQKNIDYAFYLYQHQSWGPWVAFNNGNYRGHTEI